MSVVLETLSFRKLVILGVGLLLTLIVFFLIGGLIAPAPSNVQQLMATYCVADRKDNFGDKWHIPWGDNPCTNVQSFDDPEIIKNKITSNQIVFSVRLPVRREGKNLTMHRWFQSMLSVLIVEVAYDPEHLHDLVEDVAVVDSNIIYQTKVVKKCTPVSISRSRSVPVFQAIGTLKESGEMLIEARLGAQNEGDPEDKWILIAASKEKRNLECSIEETEKVKDTRMNCSMLSFFELSSVFYDYYLMNFRLPTSKDSNANKGLGPVKDVWMPVIHQNGGFTKVWFSLKTVVFLPVIIMLVWFWKRITLLSRPANLLERTLFAVGISLSLMNLPVEWLTLWLDLPFMLLVSDIRQGIFYATLLCFWLIFAGEHMMDSIERSRVVVYWKHLSAVVFGCICLFIFDICERGVQMHNPFYTIWVTDIGKNLALAFIILAGIAASIYFVFLSYMIYCVFRNISAKKTTLPHMSSARKMYYEGLIYRFKFLMIITLLCAALTVIFFIISQMNEGHWHWGDDSMLEYTSAFFTGVYGMWNVYVIFLLSMYAPSHKRYALAHDDENEESVQLTQIPTESSAMSSVSAFIAKPATD